MNGHDAASKKARRSKSASLAQRYAYRSKKRSTIEGIALEALSGEKDCIRNLAAFGALVLEDAWKRGGNLADAAWWLSGILHTIASGKSPNEAFGYEQPGKKDSNRWKLEDFTKLERHWFLGSNVASLVNQITGKSYVDAVNIVSTTWRVSQTDAAAAMRSASPDVADISATLAKELALDVIETFGAGGARASRATISSAYFDYVRQD